MLKKLGVAATASLVGGVGAAAGRPTSNRSPQFRAAMEIREARGREAMFDYMQNNGIQILQHDVSRRKIDHGEVSTQKAEKDDLEISANVYYDSWYDAYYADTDYKVVKQKDSTFDGDNGEAPLDIAGIGWEHTDYDRVAGNPPGDPDSDSNVSSYRTGEPTGIAWNVEDAGNCCVNAGEAVWEGWANCEIVPESGTTESDRMITASYTHSWTDNADVKSVEFGTDGTIKITMTEPTDKYWDTPVKAYDSNEDS